MVRGRAGRNRCGAIGERGRGVQFESIIVGPRPEHSFGLHKAQERLSSAAQRLCHNYSDPNRAPNYATMNACYHETMDTALRQLTALAANAEARRSEVAQNQP